MKPSLKAFLVKIALMILAASLFAGCTPAAPTLTPPPTWTRIPYKWSTHMPTPNLEESDAIAETPAPPTDPGADIVYRNGVVLTMDDTNPLAQAVAIKAGKILFVGSNAEIEMYSGASTRVIDLQRQTLMPGFIDSHAHVFDYLDRDARVLENTQNWLLSKGITTIAEMNVHPDLFEWLLNAHSTGQLRMRLAIYLKYNDACGNVDGHWYADHPSAHLWDDNLRVPGIKIYADGGNCNVPAYSFEREDGNSGQLYFETGQLAQVISEAQEAGYQTAIHALGDRAEETVLNAYETALSGQPNNMRHRIEHNTMLRDDMLTRPGEVGIVPLIFGKYPACFFKGDPATFKYHIPEEYVHWEWRYGDMIENNPNLRYAWHSDYPIFDSIDPFEHLHGFATRKEIDKDGNVLCEPPEFALDDLIPPDQALLYMTINSAYATFYDDIIGSIQPGKAADLIILTDNPLEIDPDALFTISVRMTMIDGKVEYCAEGQEAYCPED